MCPVVSSVAVCRFSNTGDEWYVLVGVAKDLILNPRSVAGGFVYTYKLVNSGEKLEFLHKVRGVMGSFQAECWSSSYLPECCSDIVVLGASWARLSRWCCTLEAALEKISLLQNHVVHLLQS